MVGREREPNTVFFIICSPKYFSSLLSLLKCFNGVIFQTFLSFQTAVSFERAEREYFEEKFAGVGKVSSSGLIPPHKAQNFQPQKLQLLNR